MITTFGRCLTARATHAPHRARILGLGLTVGIAIAVSGCNQLSEITKGPAQREFEAMQARDLARMDTVIACMKRHTEAETRTKRINAYRDTCYDKPESDEVIAYRDSVTKERFVDYGGGLRKVPDGETIDVAALR